MNCGDCDCRQGRDCPIRQACELPEITVDGAGDLFTRILLGVIGAVGLGSIAAAAYYGILAL
jgi:hypothetical protein